MGHLEFPEDLFHPNIDVLGQMVLNHKETRQVLRLEKDIGPCLNAVTKIGELNVLVLIRNRSGGLRDHFTYTRL
jgi:hypothetical protein